MDQWRSGNGKGNGNGSRWFRVLDEPRDWEKFYRGRWAYDKSVRTSHGVNCSGSCSWEVFVKDGLITWELQKTDWPQINSETPNYEPRGCQRGISSSWYPYSPVRPKYPYVRGVLLDFYRKPNGKPGRTRSRPGRPSSRIRSGQEGLPPGPRQGGVAPGTTWDLNRRRSSLPPRSTRSRSTARTIWPRSRRSRR